MTETGPGATLGRSTDGEDDRCLGSGAVLPGYAVAVVDPRTRRPVPYGAEGELLVRGPSVMQGYHGQPELTAAVVDADGWLSTGDRATLREDGAIRYLGRYRELLDVGGEAVDPFEIEAVLLAHPAVGQAKVVGVPAAGDAHEVPCACVILKPGARVDAGALERHCRAALPEAMVPRRVVFVSAYPMTPTGRVQKFRLREIACTGSDPWRP
jgi:fatty-acyl-CoA synthase